ncbi:MAG TPA: hypothetical protein VFZ78_02990, partial [Flavisolibacter sp.]
MKSLIAARIGYYSAFIAAAAIAGYGIVQLLQVGGVLTFPADEILIYATSLCIAPPFLLAMMSLHHVAPNSKSPWSHAALLFAVMYAVFAIFVYVVQLGVAVPRSIRGDTAGIQVLVLTQHSFFWTL